jgi:hypothetical protein
MNIAIYAEGGAGDCMLAHKLAWVLKSTVYPDANFSAFLDTEGNPMQERVLRHLFPSFYKEIFTIPSKKYKKLVIDSQFGQEEVKGFFINVPDEWQNKIKNYDRTYNFHIDSLAFLDCPELEWVKYFNKFPRPETNKENTIFNKYILSNVISATGTEHKLANWYVKKMISDIDKFCQRENYEHLIISTPAINPLYDLTGCTKTSFYNSSVEGVCDLISNCDGLIGIDSAWRLIGHFFNKPVVTLSRNCHERGGVPLSHKLRWLPFPETTFGLHHPIQEIIKIFEKMLCDDKIYQFAPELALTDRKIDEILIKRKFKINEEKSILND